MNEEIKAFEEYLLSFGMLKKPIMPKVDVLTYTDIEYLSLICELNSEFDLIDDEYLTIHYLKGEWWK